MTADVIIVDLCGVRELPDAASRGAALGRSLEPVEVVVTKAGKFAARLKHDLLQEYGTL